MSKKDMLLKLKKNLFIVGFITSAFSLTGCAGKSDYSEEDKFQVVQNEFDDHVHLNIYVRDQLIIFRGCDNYNLITSIKIGNGSGVCHYWVKDKYDEGIIFEGYTNLYNIFEIQNEQSEEFVQGLENDLIEDGAKLYTITK